MPPKITKKRGRKRLQASETAPDGDVAYPQQPKGLYWPPLISIPWDEADRIASSLFNLIATTHGPNLAREIFDKASRLKRGEHGKWRNSFAAYDEELLALYREVTWDFEYRLAKHMRLQDAKFAELPGRIAKWLCENDWDDEVLAIFNEARREARENGRAPPNSNENEFPYRTKPYIFKGGRAELSIKRRLATLKKRHTFVWSYEMPIWPPR
jgi:hypothetical protein